MYRSKSVGAFTVSCSVCNVHQKLVVLMDSYRNLPAVGDRAYAPPECAHHVYPAAATSIRCQRRSVLPLLPVGCSWLEEKDVPEVPTLVVPGGGPLPLPSGCRGELITCHRGTHLAMRTFRLTRCRPHSTHQVILSCLPRCSETERSPDRWRFLQSWSECTSIYISENSSCCQGHTAA